MSPSLLRKEVVMEKCCIYAHENGCAHIYHLKVPLWEQIQQWRRYIPYLRFSSFTCFFKSAIFSFDSIPDDYIPQIRQFWKQFVSLLSVVVDLPSNILKWNFYQILNPSGQFSFGCRSPIMFKKLLFFLNCLCISFYKSDL